MNLVQALYNAATRHVPQMFPGYFPGSKHNHYKDFGWPEDLTFDQLYSMFRRNGLAKSGVLQTKLKTWEDYPALWETEEPAETTAETEVAQRFESLRFWQHVAESDKRSMVSGYAGLIFRFADNKTFREPVDRVPGGLMGLVEVIPAWSKQLEVSSWDTDETSETYGKPKMFHFNEANVESKANKNRSFEVHPDRVVIWSDDGTVHGIPMLEAGYNDLMSLEKISGAGGEGFWKNAKSGFAIEVDKEAKLKEMAEAMGVETDQLYDAMDEQIEGFNKGFDKSLMLQGMQAKPVSISLPSPEHFFNIALQSFAASVPIPLKILVGSQTGERASTEDANAWAKTNNARRTDVARPNIREIINRLRRFGILRDIDWVIGWTDLTEATMAEKVERAHKMADINQKNGPDEPVYQVEEIREVTGHDAKLKPNPDSFDDDEEGDDA